MDIRPLADPAFPSNRNQAHEIHMRADVGLAGQSRVGDHAQMQNLLDFNYLLELPKDVLPRIYFKNKRPSN